MEVITNLNLNVNITLFTQDLNNPRERSSQVLKGHICSKEADRSIIIEIHTDQNINLPAGGKHILLFLAHDLGLYILSAVVGQTSLESGKIIMQCRNLQQVKYFQRRKSVRVNVSIPVNFSPQSDRSGVFEGTITDLSVGGLQLESAGDVQAGSIIELVFNLDDTGPLFMDGKVVRATKKDDRFVCGVEFINPDQLYIDGIARYIIREQIRQKRLGLNVFKVFIIEGTVEAQTPTIFSIVQYKNLDISTLQGKKCSGNILQISMCGLIFQCPLKIPAGAVLEFAVELPQLGRTVLQAVVKDITERSGRFLIWADFISEQDKVKDYLLELLARDFGVPYL